MELYLLRHADAADPGPSGSDRERPLTAKGRDQSRRVAGALRAPELAFDLILTSPYVRARQTAEIVAGALGAAGQLQDCDHLAPGGDPKKLVAALRKQAGETVLVVGHEPYLSALISVLLAGTPEVSVTMKKAGLCKLAVDSLKYGACATLEWLAPPKLLAPR